MGTERIPCVLVGTDGSVHARHAARTGLAVLGDPARVVVVSAVPPIDPMAVTGTGFAGGVASPEQYDEMVEQQRRDAADTVSATVAELGERPVESMVLWGDAGRELCALAEDLPATAVVVGSRGLGGLKRLVLGSVSRHVVQHAPCSVLVVPGDEP